MCKPVETKRRQEGEDGIIKTVCQTKEDRLDSDRREGTCLFLLQVIHRRDIV